MKEKLQTVVLDILCLAESNNVRICPVWIPREDNLTADLLSRLPYNDADDWKIILLCFTD